MMNDDPFDLERFVIEQNKDGIYEVAIKELRAGQKRSDWMWFVFPQLHREGLNSYSERFAIRSREEAIAYLEHDVLGPRLRRCTRLVARSGAVSARVLMGSSVDESKLKSSMTLFAEVSDEDDDFVAVLRKYFPAGRDQETLKKLKPTSPTPQASSQTKHRRRRWPRRRRTDD